MDSSSLPSAFWILTLAKGLALIGSNIKKQSGSYKKETDGREPSIDSS